MFDDDFPPRPGPRHKAGPLPSPGELLRLVGLNPKVRVISPDLNPEEWERIKREEESLPPAPVGPATGPSAQISLFDPPHHAGSEGSHKTPDR